MAGTIKITGDIITPIEQEWSAITGNEDEFYAGLAIREDTLTKTKSPGKKRK